MKRWLLLVTMFVVSALILTACPAPTPQVIEVEKPVVVEKKVVETVVVEKEVPVEKVVKETVVVEKEVEKIVEKEVPVEVVVMKPGPEAVLDFIFVQHALCAWDSFWCTVEAGIRQAADDMNVNVTVLGPDEFDLEKVAQLIDQAVAAHRLDGDRSRPVP